LGRFVFLLGAVESADPGASAAAAALEDAIYESESNLIDLRLKIENWNPRKWRELGMNRVSVRVCVIEESWLGQFGVKWKATPPNKAYIQWV